jgi:hypothetical protein
MTGGLPPINSSWYEAPRDPWSVYFSSEHLRLYFLCNILSDENGSVVYDCCWPSPEESFSGPSPAGLMTTFYCLRFETPPIWGTRSPYLYPPRTGCPSYDARHWVPNSSRLTTQRATVKVFQPASWDPRYVASGRTHRKHRSFSYTVSTGTCLRRPTTGCLPRICCPSNRLFTLFLLQGTCLLSRCPAMDVSSGSTISAFRRHVISELRYFCNIELQAGLNLRIKPSPEEDGVDIMLKTCIRKVSGSSLSQDICYCDWGSFVVFLTPSRQMPR